MEWSCHVGTGVTSTRGNKFFETPHNIPEKPFTCLGVDLRSPFEKKNCQHEWWKLQLYNVASAMFYLVDPEYVKMEYVIHFSKMSSQEHQVPRHTDDRDIGHQILVNLGFFFILHGIVIELKPFFRILEKCNT